MRSIHIVVSVGVFVWNAGAAQLNNTAWFEQVSKAGILQQANHVEEAEAAYQLALSEAKKLGADSQELGITLNNLGHFSHRLGRYMEAEQQLTRSLMLMEARLGPGTTTYRIAANVAGLYVETGQDTRAEQVLRRFLPTNILSVRHPELAALVGILGILHARHDEYEEAERCYQHAIGVLEPQPQILYREYTAVLLSNLADLYGNARRKDEALISAQRALAILDTVPSAVPAATLAVLNNAASVLVLTGSPEKAEPLFRRAVAVSENAFGTELTMLVNVFANYRECLRKLKRPDEAKTVEKQARTILTKHLRANGMRQTIDARALRSRR